MRYVGLLELNLRRSYADRVTGDHHEKLLSGIAALAGLAVASSSFTADAGTSVTPITSRAQQTECERTGDQTSFSLMTMKDFGAS